jgi:carbamoyl-phosphate synthase large subunit
MLSGKRIFISGGNGVIGNTLVRKLHEQGALLFVGDLKPRPLHWPKNIRYRQGDLNFITKRELENFAPEYFFHLAATFERSTETYEFWEENYWHNVHLSNHLTSLLKDSKELKKIIFASSYLIYNPDLYNFSNPQAHAYKLKETDPIYPRNLTGVAKLNHEIELRFLEEFRSTQFKTVSARIYRSYGRNSRDIISRWIRSLLKGETLTLYRKEGMFDYIYADEVAEGLIKLAGNEKTQGIYNLGNDNARKVSDVIDVLKIHFPSLKYTEVKSDIPFEASQANMDYFYENIGWKPAKQLEDAIPEIIQYEKENTLRHLETEANFSVLVSSISRKIPMIKAVKQASAKLSTQVKVAGADANDACIGKYFVDSFWKMPKISELNISDIIEYCKKNNIRAVIPSRDGELMFWAKHKNILAQNKIHVMISQPEAIEACVDKLSFFNSLKNKLPVIPTSSDINEIKAENFVVKERYGAGSLNIGVNLKKAEAIKFAEKLNSPVFQPFIKGTEYSIDAYADKKGKTKGVVVRTRDLVVNGESQITSTLENAELEKICIKLIELLGLYGHVVIQAIEDEKGNFNILECNSRFGGASTLSIAAGLDTFYWFLLESTDADIEEYPFLKVLSQLKQVRFPEDIVI